MSKYVHHGNPVLGEEGKQDVYEVNVLRSDLKKVTAVVSLHLMQYMAKIMGTPACPTSLSEASALLGWLSIRCWNISGGICLPLRLSVDG